MWPTVIGWYPDRKNTLSCLTQPGFPLPPWNRFLLPLHSQLCSRWHFPGLVSIILRQTWLHMLLLSGILLYLFCGWVLYLLLCACFWFPETFCPAGRLSHLESKRIWEDSGSEQNSQVSGMSWKLQDPQTLPQVSWNWGRMHPHWLIYLQGDAGMQLLCIVTMLGWAFNITDALVSNPSLSSCD